MSGSVVQLPDPDLLTFSNNKSPKDQNLTYFLNLQHPFFSVSSIRPEQKEKREYEPEHKTCVIEMSPIVKRTAKDDHLRGL